ncbi:helicase c2 [Beutenbergia cavernae DSM 12333]|uniref:ATP-dependent helicase DinG n=1 Tax=Beutenbergia cavernae (strain ATCC BAA-8 / DSM 12333 / CCUG 43141 / JCM 11478 / NBRC 16432 / NCIMB 13614 / HKI 0122) TaxID=471853 RepID=C5BWL9_BEUC1|nr:helicase c2 [Beutenbergia cavernae DSM 12333]
MTLQQPTATTADDADEEAARTPREALDVDALLDEVVARMGGTRRAGQHEMALAVAHAFDDGVPLLVQAGTGTGKSLAYLVPAIVRAVTSDERIIVSTATLALQRQILTKDLPLARGVLEASLPRPPAVALLKGWHNYVCRHKVTGGYPAEDEPGLFSLDGGADHPRRSAEVGEFETLGEEVVRLREWAEETTTGDRDDLVPGVGERAWRQVSVTAMECLGQKCPMLAECFPEAARRASRSADVVVTNHAMLGIAAGGSPGVLPEHDGLVVDEAHELADRVTAQATVELSAPAVERAARIARRHAGAALAGLDDAAQALRTGLGLVPEGRLPDGLPESLVGTVTTLRAAAHEGMSALGPNPPGSTDGAGALVMARSALLVLVEIADRLLSDAVAQRRDVLWCERGRDGASRLRVAPLDVAGLVATHLVADRAAVLTSATLELGGSFAPVASSLGLATGAYRAERVASPFDYARQGIRYVARHLPRPGSDGPSQEMLAELAELVQAAGGRTLGLFSSRRAAEVAAQEIRDRTGLDVLCQGEDVLPTLVRRFAEEEATSLFGTLSLWQGVDVPGDSCRLVTIDRIPFPRPDDPVGAARMEVVAARGGNPFMTVAATHAALLLAQGAGRLLRRTTDRGVVAILDSRLATARYGEFLSRSLPPMWPTTDPAVARAALVRLGSDS